MTDAQGRFVVRGLGRDRLAILRIDGPAIRPLEIKVLTRPGRRSRRPFTPSSRNGVQPRIMGLHSG